MSTPASTYRLQLHAGFTMDDAAGIVDYLADLGADAVYLSPILRAVSGSTHGYDVADHQEIDPERGGPAGFARLVAAAHAAGLGVVVDVVPNHAGIADPPQNPPWWDVLTYGQESVFASWFDIDWTQGPIVVPILGDDFDLDTELTIDASERTVSGLELHYYEHAFPVAPGTGPTGDEKAADVLARQAYQLVSWRVGNQLLNYRRFFAIAELAGLRVEDPDVFAATHRILLEHVASGDITGLRIDHPDGLVDPGQYLDRLAAAAPDAWITVEKILEPGEDLPEWPVAGTTGYDALTEVTQVLTDPRGAGALTATFVDLTADARDYVDWVAAGKRDAATQLFPAEVRRLARLTPDIADASAAISELSVAFAVYRSYLPLGVEYLDEAIASVTSTRPDLGPALTALSPRLHDPADELARRFQQLTGADMAKGVEDTAYYRYTRAVWLNEVGGDPGAVGADLETFHRAQVRRQQRFASGMTTLTTHDTKRGEDVRARLAVLAERPDRWDSVARRLTGLVPIADPAIGLLLWQTFIGAGFIDRERMHAYAEKAMREANTKTSWTDPDETFEATVHAAVDAGYDNGEVHALLNELIEDVTGAGWSNALSQKLIQLTMPGVPDIYQGNEVWDDSLVDPDNRRPVDYVRRRQLLAELRSRPAGSPPPALDSTGAAKLHVVIQTLHARRDRPELFTDYRPLRADGPAADHLVAYDRGGAVTFATRLPVGLRAQGGWDGTAVLLEADYTDAFTGTRFEAGPTAVADLLAYYPVALLLTD